MSAALTNRAAISAAARPATQRRLRSMRIIAWIMAGSASAFGLLTVVLGIVGPGQEAHAVHNAVVASLLLVLSAPPAIAVARSPQRSTRPLVVLALLAVAAVVSMTLSLTLDPFTLPFVVLTGVLWAMHRRSEAVLPTGRPSPILLVMILAAAVPLLGYAVEQAEFQRIDIGSSHGAFFHWVEMSFYAIAVLMLGFLAAMRPAAHRLAAWSAGLGLAVLAAASLALGAFASALEAHWAWAALVGSGVFVGVTEWEARRPKPGTGGTEAARAQK